MPRNDVVERMAKKIHRTFIMTHYSDTMWERSPESEREMCRREALELLGIVEEHCSRLRFPTPEGVDRYVVADDELVEVFQLAREARERREKT